MRVGCRDDGPGKVELLRRTLANGILHHPDFIEVYEVDANDPSLAQVLTGARQGLLSQ